MTPYLKITSAVIALFVLGFAGYFFMQNKKTPQDFILQNDTDQESVSKNIISESSKSEFVNFEFAALNSFFRFSGDVSDNFQVEYVPGSESINIFNPNIESLNNLEKSQIFIKYFKANTFLTLSTVDILNKENDEVNGHSAVRYEIVKKPGIANFVSQPSWRSEQHKLIDIQLADQTNTFFYVFSYNPEFPEEEFEKFINSLRFHNDLKSFVPPIENAKARITKKPLGLKVSPGNSPVTPEIFSGYHTGTDFEIFENEQDADVPIFAMCGGTLQSKRTASGYGGLAVQNCLLDDELITVLYGHIDVKSMGANIGDYIYPEQKIAVLGDVGLETDGQRKHLHLGILKDGSKDIRGYVQSFQELNLWYNFEEIVEI